MELTALARHLSAEIVSGGPVDAMDIVDVTHDSRTVAEGILFCCVPGHQVDGHDFASAAMTAGASALLCSRPLPLPVPQLVVPEVRAAMAAAAAAVHGNPSRQLTLCGVTGTNGKTTVTHMLASIAGAAGVPAAMIGTLSGARTTPESSDLQRLLARHRDAGIRHVVLEVSSHGLVQHRVDGCRFAAVGFTNLSPDHLEYHGSMEAYFEAKAALFTPDRAAAAVVDTSGPWGTRLAERIADQGMDLVTVDLADAADLVLGPTQSTFTWRGRDVSVPMPGRFNVANALLAAEMSVVVGLAPDAVVDGLTGMEPVPGRVEPVVAGQPFTVLVDYAHTPDGLDSVLALARETTPGSVIVVFGCGGDRDTAKRGEMGRIASEGSDLALVTTDNPRGEDPVAIIDEVVGGAPDSEKLRALPDRREAIATALGHARPGDTVVIAGKGHETTQVFADRTVPFDDRMVVRELLRAAHEREGSW